MHLPERAVTTASSSKQLPTTALQLPRPDHSSSKRRRQVQPEHSFPDSDLYFRQLVCKNVGNIKPRLRALEGIVQDAVAGKADLPEVHEKLEAGLEYSAEVRKQGHGLKKPHLYVWSAMVKTLIRGPDLSPNLATRPIQILVNLETSLRIALPGDAATTTRLLSSSMSSQILSHFGISSKSGYSCMVVLRQMIMKDHLQKVLTSDGLMNMHNH
eukprot:TRINITY_DN18852_c0_g1_i1.p1 TRINITY_DN18852_c0_g1~~TRINITY_DN18852_c0_g1_i1.p1  ORF type:complete len:213 (+),score=4.14 TRINITY_DN18852_c0_g1_i1:150-788(+)